MLDEEVVLVPHLLGFLNSPQMCKHRRPPEIPPFEAVEYVAEPNFQLSHWSEPPSLFRPLVSTESLGYDARSRPRGCINVNRSKWGCQREREYSIMLRRPVPVLNSCGVDGLRLDLAVLPSCGHGEIDQTALAVNSNAHTAKKNLINEIARQPGRGSRTGLALVDFVNLKGGTRSSLSYLLLRGRP